MSYHEKRNIVLIVGSFITWTVYSLVAARFFPGIGADPAQLLRYWGIVFLLFIPVQIISKILGMIVFTIFYNVSTGENGPNFTDERDQLIELKSFRVSTYIFMVGFLIAMGALALGLPLSVMFVIIAASTFVGDLVEETFQIRLYRRGF